MQRAEEVWGLPAPFATVGAEDKGPRSLGTCDAQVPRAVSLRPSTRDRMVSEVGIDVKVHAGIVSDKTRTERALARSTHAGSVDRTAD